jgi:hypothetical protein
LSVGREYPELVEPNRKLLWSWSILVAILVLACLGVAVLSNVTGVKSIVSSDGGALNWEILFGISAIAVLVVGALLPQISAPKAKIENPASKPRSA